MLIGPSSAGDNNFLALHATKDSSTKPSPQLSAETAGANYKEGYNAGYSYHNSGSDSKWDACEGQCIAGSYQLLQRSHAGCCLLSGRSINFARYREVYLERIPVGLLKAFELAAVGLAVAGRTLGLHVASLLA